MLKAMPILTDSSQRTTYMTNSKEDPGFLPQILPKQRLGSSSDNESVIDFHRDRYGSTSGTSTATSVSSSPIKLPNIDKTKSNSISSLPHGKGHRSRSYDRTVLCRSPSCPSNIGYFRTKDDSPLYWHPDACKFETSSPEKDSDSGIRLPDIFKDSSTISGASRSTNRSQSTNRSPPFGNRGGVGGGGCGGGGGGRDYSPTTFRNEMALCFTREKTKVSNLERTPRLDTARDQQDTYRSSTQSALLLPIRNSESRLSLKGKKRKKYSSRQNTQVSIQSDCANMCQSLERVRSARKNTRANKSDHAIYNTFREVDGANAGDDSIRRSKDENSVSSNKDGANQVARKPAHCKSKHKDSTYIAPDRETAQIKS
ncbi:uncharacterized protein LOC121372093 [Gigantopelta aegis]|uniref:uncharacterized protein LOC121372093 n=1 Tax=Gigantopelta aegis TaxID=1735272 RepID=UPI001B88A92E|nr:uncharacterized protein LOC121372093 [Gigantopelta aegis]